VARRATRLWERTGELAELIRAVAGRHHGRHLPAEARCFQALRIAVNGELEQLAAALDQAHQLLAPGGRLVVISFHSLEDRLVKQRLRYWAERCLCPPGMPECRCGKQVTMRVLTRKPLEASAAEVAANRRAASAKLRGGERLSPPTTPLL
jgi:16S rRNA (cytosine1402-N4)-methyltransferase